MKYVRGFATGLLVVFSCAVGHAYDDASNVDLVLPEASIDESALNADLAELEQMVDPSNPNPVLNANNAN